MTLFAVNFAVHQSLTNIQNAHKKSFYSNNDGIQTIDASLIRYVYLIFIAAFECNV